MRKSRELLDNQRCHVFIVTEDLRKSIPIRMPIAASGFIIANSTCWMNVSISLGVSAPCDRACRYLCPFLRGASRKTGLWPVACGAGVRPRGFDERDVRDECLGGFLDFLL